MASMPTGYDFCYDPNYGVVPLVARITADDKGSSGCTSSSKCAAGGGDCDSDADCNSGLKCMQRGRRRRGGSQYGLAVPGVNTGSDNNQDYCYDPSLLDITSAGPCNQPAAFNLDWRATETWCAANRDGAMEYGSIRLNRETTNLATDAEEFLVYEAGVKKVVGDNSYSVCGCKQTVFKMKRRKEHYGTSSTLTCPDTATTVNGVSAGPDIAGAYWCPVQQPYRTASVIGGCYNCGPSPCSFPDAKFRHHMLCTTHACMAQALYMQHTHMHASASSCQEELRIFSTRRPAVQLSWLQSGLWSVALTPSPSCYTDRLSVPTAVYRFSMCIPGLVNCNAQCPPMPGL